MANFTDFSLGMLLWLGSGSFLLTFFNTTLDDEISEKSDSVTLSPTVDDSPEVKAVSPLVVDNQINQDLVKTIEALKQEKEKSEVTLTATQMALRDAEEKIKALESQLDSVSDELEFSQDKYYQLEKDSQNQIHDLNNKLMDLGKNYQNLQVNYDNLPDKLYQDWQEKMFSQINDLVTSYPTAKMMVKVKPDLPAKNIISLLKPLENLLSLWDIQPIGKPWQKVNFNPDLHQPDSTNIKIDDLVYIRFVGYIQGENVLIKAKVSHSLPGQK